MRYNSVIFIRVLKTSLIRARHEVEKNKLRSSDIEEKRNFFSFSVVSSFSALSFSRVDEAVMFLACMTVTYMCTRVCVCCVSVAVYISPNAERVVISVVTPKLYPPKMACRTYERC